MDYIVFDLEFNQSFNFNKGKAGLPKPTCPFEIIQLGAVKLDENLNITGHFDRFIKPTIYKRLHPYVKKITGISMSQLKSAKPFKEVYNEFVNFTGKDSVFGVWGTADIKELLRNITYHKLDTSLMPVKYIDIQMHANRHLKRPSGTSVGLENAVELLNIPTENEFHNAFNDAFYTAKVLEKIYSDKIKPEIYNYQKNIHNEDSAKTVLDMNKLLRQFEKMYKREMTDEEKSMIKLAYHMGYTKQFQKLQKSAKG